MLSQMVLSWFGIFREIMVKMLARAAVSSES